MKKVVLKYNPYIPQTSIIIDGKDTKVSSNLYYGDRRLHEWVEEFPDELVKYTQDKNIELSFIGTAIDFDDLEESFEHHPDINIKYHKDFVRSVADTQVEIENIFEEIKNGPIAELKGDDIEKAFAKAKNQEFEVNVVATMSAGKSTLINALIQTDLMPHRQEATTATITRIIDNDKHGFSAKAYDQNGNLYKEVENLDLKIMNELNDDSNVSSVDVEGDIPFVDITNNKLIFVDTPGPNNSRDITHREKTYSMLSNSDRSLVVYVINSDSFAVNDDSVFLDYVCSSMKKCGKQSKDRFIFVVNKLDNTKKSESGKDCITKALDRVKDYIEQRGIKNPNVFPVSAYIAMCKRTGQIKDMDYRKFKMMNEDEDEKTYHFNEYYEYTHLPQTARAVVDKLLADAKDDNERNEVYSGIVSVEQAIALYVDKYARNIKICNLVQTFSAKLIELNYIANIELSLASDEKKREALKNDTRRINSLLDNVKEKDKYKAKIKALNIKSELEKSVDGALDPIQDRMSEIIEGASIKLDRYQAQAYINRVAKELEDTKDALSAKIKEIIRECSSKTMARTITEYRNYLKGVSDVSLSGSTSNIDLSILAAAQINNMCFRFSTVINSSYIDRKDEGYDEWVKQEGAFSRVKRFFGNLIGEESWGRKKVHVENWVEQVDIHRFIQDKVGPMRQNIDNLRGTIVDSVEKSVNQIKTDMIKELDKIDIIVRNKIKELDKIQLSVKSTEKDIEETKKKLNWMKGIIQRVDSIINF